MQKVETKVSQKLGIELPERFTRLATKFDVSVEWLAQFAVDLFADEPPDEIRFVEPAPVAKQRKAALAA